MAIESTPLQCSFGLDRYRESNHHKNRSQVQSASINPPEESVVF
jgi:hypothetical protein